MKKIFLISLLTLSSVAFADEQANWAGPYLGVSAGYTHGNSDSQTVLSGSYYTPTNTNTINSLGTESLDGNNGLFGFKAGYNWRNNNLIYGITTSANSTNLNETISNTSSSNFYNITRKVSSDNLFTLEGKLGFIYNEQSLFYMTAGVASTNLKFKRNFNDYQQSVVSNNSISSQRLGPTIGFGLENPLTDNWFLSAEYKYAKFSNISGSNRNIADASTGDIYVQDVLFKDKVNLDINLISLSLTKHF